MDKSKAAARIESINARISDLKSDSLDGVGGVLQHVTSPYYKKALRGEADVLLPARDAQTYRRRLAEFGLGPNFANRFQSAAMDLPNSNGQRWHVRSAKSIAIVADDFLFKSLEGTANLIRITPANFSEHVRKVDLLLVTSTWKGMTGEWIGVSNQATETRKLLEDFVIPAYAKAGVPVAFYSKEDPPNYGRFLSIAKKCEFIFTSAAEVVTKYERDCPEAASVDVLPFSVNPQHHNPVGSHRHKIEEVTFAGSWHRHKYPQRRAAGIKIFDGVEQSDRDLVIIDRNSELDFDRYLFPERFIPHIADAVEHELLLRIQRMSDISINLNSVIGSQTMFANRVVELQAMGTSVISNYNAGVNSLFPNVLTPDSADDARDMINALRGKHLFRNQMAGLRTVYADHVNQLRMDKILASVGISEAPTQRTIGVICENQEFARSFIEQQSTSVPMRIYASAQECLLGESTIALPVSPRLNYGANFTQDLVNGFKYTDSQFISKSMGTDVNHEYISTPVDRAATAFWVDSQLEDRLDGSISGPSRGYVVDPFEVDLKPRERIETSSVNSSLSVIVPVFNNGRHLRHKCFESLLRSSVFSEMEILLIDDGSTDGDTVQIVKDLERSHSNVRAIFNAYGGSGSASRPRNQGLSMATSTWVTYLDPDNEAINDGYAKLLVLACAGNANFAIGDMVRNDSTRKLVSNTTILSRGLQMQRGSTWSVPKDALSRINFQPMSIQALVANTAWLQNLNLVQPLGAVGQDSYFFQQMLHYAERVALLDLPIHTYYATVANSTVNSISANFYRKYLPLERARSNWLREVGLLEDYNEKRLEAFVKGWYIKKLQRVVAEEQAESIDIIRQIAAMFGEVAWEDSDVREFFELSR